MADERLLSAQRARRRMFVRGLSGIFGGLTILALAQMAAVHAPVLALLANAVALLGFAIAFWISNRPQDVPWGAVVLLSTMQVQYFVSAISVDEPAEVAITIMFSGILPLIAAATLSLRGTWVVSVAAVFAVFAVFAEKVLLGSNATRLGRALGAPLFFVLTGVVVGILWAIAERRALAQARVRERDAADAKAAAASAEQRLRLVADQVSDLVTVIDAQGYHLFASASYERILGVTPAEITGVRDPGLMHPDDRPQGEHAFREAIEGREREIVARLRSKRTGEYRTFHIRFIGLELDGRRQVAITSRDITEMQALSEELESVRRMEALGRLAGGVAHDFNNLLAVIGSCASMLKGQVPPGRGHRDIEIIDDAVHKAALLTGQLLSFARRQVLPEGRTAPGQAVHELGSLLTRAVGPRVELSLDASKSSWVAQLSTGALEQIIMNLAVNARDAMPEGGKLAITVCDRPIASGEVPDLQAGDHIVIEVADTGAGMDPEVKSRIFEPFFTTKGAGKGTGLGLSTSFGVARQVGGTLTVESTPGAGSVFRVYLPRAADELRPLKPESASPALGPEGRLVLVVDDEERISELVARLLEMAGHRAVIATSAGQAIEEARKQRFDVMLVDVVLGDADGLDTLARLRELQPRAHPVVMSGYFPSPQRLGVLRETGIGFLAKPFAVGSLLRIVAPGGPTELQAEEQVD